MNYDELRVDLAALLRSANEAEARRANFHAKAAEAGTLSKEYSRSAKAIKTLLRGAGEPYGDEVAGLVE